MQYSIFDNAIFFIILIFIHILPVRQWLVSTGTPKVSVLNGMTPNCHSNREDLLATTLFTYFYIREGMRLVAHNVPNLYFQKTDICQDN